MFNYKYLSREHLEGFDNYKYMAIDTSPLSVYVMHPFWNKVVELVPKWVAPNVLTFGGFLLIILNFLFLSYYDYDYYAASTPVYNETIGEVPLNGHEEIIPQSLWYAIGVFLFLAYTLDGIDGKQARRTQTSGPLGELFDHGLDSYTVFFIPACLYSIFGRADYSIPPIRIYYVMWNLLLNFYISHWEKYNTGVLFLPWGYDFSMWASTAFFLWTGVKGTSFYKKYLFSGYTVANVFEVLIYATGVCTNLPVALYNIYQSYKLRTGKMRTATEALRPLWSFLTVFVVCSVWVHKSSHLPDYDLRALFLLYGTLFSNVACRLIVSQMSNQRCDAVNWLLWPLTFSATLSLLLPHYEVAAFYGMTLLTIAAHIHYGTCVIPNSAEEWLDIENGFSNKFPRCVGSLDGKHIVMQSPFHSGSTYYNYKKSFSIVLMALVNSNYNFVYVNIGGQGKISDGGIFQNCELWRRITSDSLFLPPPRPLPGSNKPVPYVFLGDGAFSLSTSVMKPYPGNHDLGTPKREFNKKLSSARVVVENTFGILASKFRVFRKPLMVCPDKVSLITMTCVLLHNFLRKSDTSRPIYTPPGMIDVYNDDGIRIQDGSWRSEIQDTCAIRDLPQIPRRPSLTAIEIREEFTKYFTYNIGI